MTFFVVFFNYQRCEIVSDRCDLNVGSEIDVVDAGIVWIWQQKKLLINSALVFSRIRSAFLSHGDRKTIEELLKTLPNGDKVRLSSPFFLFFSFKYTNVKLE